MMGSDDNFLWRLKKKLDGSNKPDGEAGFHSKQMYGLSL
jgi:hypothetical protein